MITRSGDRRFVAEALFAAQLIVDLGASEQQQRMGELTDELAAGDDTFLGALAHWVQTHPLSAEEIEDTVSDSTRTPDLVRIRDRGPRRVGEGVHN